MPGKGDQTENRLSGRTSKRRLWRLRPTRTGDRPAGPANGRFSWPSTGCRGRCTPRSSGEWGSNTRQSERRRGQRSASKATTADSAQGFPSSPAAAAGQARPKGRPHRKRFGQNGRSGCGRRARPRRRCQTRPQSPAWPFQRAGPRRWPGLRSWHRQRRPFPQSTGRSRPGFPSIPPPWGRRRGRTRCGRLLPMQRRGRRRPKKSRAPRAGGKRLPLLWRCGGRFTLCSPRRGFLPNGGGAGGRRAWGDGPG